MKFDSIRAVQAKYPVYSFYCEFKDVSDIFDLQENNVDKIQRKLMPGRVKIFCDYLIKNQESFVIPAITASIETDSDCFGSGVLTIDKKLKIIDGQHRIAGIVEYMEYYNFIKTKPRINKEAIERTETYNFLPVTLYHVFSENRAKKIFFDINKNSIKPTKRILDLFCPYGD